MSAVPDVIVLCYHAVSPSWEATLSTTPERLEGHLRLLRERGYRGVTFSDAIQPGVHGKLLSVTFDDAFRSVIELALPILERAGIPGTVFAPTDFIDAGGPLLWPGIDGWFNGPRARELTPMSWTELRTLADAGWEVGSHTGSHPRLTRLDNLALDDELARSKAACEEHLGRACTSIAYPFGDVDPRVVAATAKAGYMAAAALPNRLDSGGPLEWPRIGVYRIDDERRFRLKVSPAVRRLRRSSAWDLMVKRPVRS